MASEYKDIFNGLFEFYVDLGFSEAEAEAKALREAPDVLERGLSREMDASGGRVGLQEGGEADDLTYDQIVKDIMETYPEGADAQTITRPSPQVEALQNILGPQLATFAGTPIRPGAGGQTIFGDTYGAFTPEAQAQNIIQQQAIQQALEQAGVTGTAQFDKMGELTGISGLGQGVAGFQPFLTEAQKATDLAQQAAFQGQGAGATALQNAADQAKLANENQKGA